jgi:hypothetical protein
LEIHGNIVLANPSNINNLTTDNIAFLTCDPANYTTGMLSFEKTISLVTDRITSQQDSAHGAIILYSTVYDWCNFTVQGSDYTYKNVFIMPMHDTAKTMETTIRSLNTSLPGTIAMNLSSNNPGSGGDDDQDSGLGPTPTTTVAMIILYSVTGVITLCFIVVIITGAVRAHRHPDRYGLLNLPGGAHQRRARGIARAMLDTIPIVKFGEREPVKMPQDPEHGVELSNRTESPVQSSTVQNTEQSTSVPNDESQRDSPESQQTGDGAADTRIETELACSVCTDDFVRGEDTRVLPCGHKFHPNCIDPWLLNVSGTCPLW